MMPCIEKCVTPGNYVNSLWPSAPTWHHRTWSTLVQVMAYCLMAPSHQLMLTHHQWGSVRFIHLRCLKSVQTLASNSETNPEKYGEMNHIYELMILFITKSKHYKKSYIFYKINDMIALVPVMQPGEYGWIWIYCTDTQRTIIVIKRKYATTTVWLVFWNTL